MNALAPAESSIRAPSGKPGVEKQAGPVRTNEASRQKSRKAPATERGPGSRNAQ
jgi:hypothetical protein